MATTRISRAALRRALAAEERPEPRQDTGLGHPDVVRDDALRRALAAHRAIFQPQLLFAAAHRSEVEPTLVARTLRHDHADRRLRKPPFVGAARLGYERQVQPLAVLHADRAALLARCHRFRRVRIPRCRAAGREQRDYERRLHAAAGCSAWRSASISLPSVRRKCASGASATIAFILTCGSASSTSC